MSPTDAGTPKSNFWIWAGLIVWFLLVLFLPLLVVLPSAVTLSILVNPGFRLGKPGAPAHVPGHSRRAPRWTRCRASGHVRDRRLRQHARVPHPSRRFGSCVPGSEEGRCARTGGVRRVLDPYDWLECTLARSCGSGANRTAWRSR